MNMKLRMMDKSIRVRALFEKHLSLRLSAMPLTLRRQLDIPALHTHALREVLPASDDECAGQSRHCELEVAPSSTRNLPISHGSHSPLP
jgi:hypothetical protein